MKTPKEELYALLERLPDDVSFDTLIIEMHYKASILRGLAEARRGEGVDQEEVERELNQWLESSGRLKHGAT